MRIRFILVATVASLIVVAVTELLSLGHLLTRDFVLYFWIASAALAVGVSSRVVDPASFRTHLAQLDRFERLCIAAIVAISALNLLLALVAAPSARDALAYHIPRVSHWIQNRSVAHYPTHIDRQLWISPGPEFFALHLKLITGSDRFTNIVQWLASIGCVLTASVIAAQLGAARRAQIIAALFAATVPMAVAQASGSQTDLFAAFWISASVVLLLRVIQVGGQQSWKQSLILGACCGLAVFAKGTAYIILAPFAAWAMASSARRLRARVLMPLAIAVTVALLVNIGHLARNYALYGNALTNPRNTAVINEAMTPALLVSNLVRNTTLHMYTRSARVNRWMQSCVEKAHALAGISVDDPRTTFFITRYDIKARPRTEGRVGNHLHLALLVAAGLWLCFRRRKGTPLIYFLSLCAAYLLFCAVLKWQPWNSRLQLPLFILAAGLVGYVADKLLSPRALKTLAALLVIAAMPILLRNAVRPVISGNPIWSIPRERRYFIEAPNIYGSHVAAARLLALHECSRIGLVTSWGDFEELIWVVMRRRSASPVEIRHILFTPDEPSVAERQVESYPGMCAIVTDYTSDLLKPPRLDIPSGWKLAFDRYPLKIYFPQQLLKHHRRPL